MKKLKVLLLVILSCLLLSGCNSSELDSEEEVESRFITVDIVQDVDIGHFYIIKDTETGVNYIYIRTPDKAALSPLYDSNGEIVVD